MLKQALISKTRLMKIAHRGYVPENKMQGFKEAVIRGCDMFECDLRLSADKHPMVIHDKTINRTTNNVGHVNMLTKCDLEFYGIPSLEELLQWFQSCNGLFAAFELKDIGKTSNSILLSKTIALLRKYNVVERSILISFNTHIVKTSKTLCPDLYTGIIYLGRNTLMRNPFNIVKDTNADMLWANHKIISALLPMNKNNTPICIWTVNNKKHITALDKNVVGIVSDDLQQVFRD
jgi:glycerophosphoryl diester phosphodiesterase